MQSAKFPNLFIVGAPKSGTTTLAYWMRHHPQVFVCTPKEPMFYCGFDEPFGGPGADDINAQVVTERDAYLDLFAGAGGARYLVDASTDYLSCPEAAERIKADSPNAGIIMLLRNPVERAFSEHSHLVRDNLETLPLREALAQETERRAANWNTLFRHVERGLYADAVTRFLPAFGSEKVFIALHDDLRVDPDGLRRRVFSFLGLEDLELGVPRLNQSGIVKSQLLYDLSRGRILPTSVKALIRAVVGRRRLSNLQARVSSANLKKLNFSDDDRAALVALFRDDVAAVIVPSAELETWKSGH